MISPRAASSPPTPRRCRSAPGAGGAPRRNRFVGLHFFSPVQGCRWSRSSRQGPPTTRPIARGYDYVLAIGKTPIVVNDSRGFFTSRVFGTLRDGRRRDAGRGHRRAADRASRPGGRHAGRPAGGARRDPLSLSVHVIEQTCVRTSRPRGAPTRRWPARRWSSAPVKELNRAGRCAGGGFTTIRPASPSGRGPA